MPALFCIVSCEKKRENKIISCVLRISHMKHAIVKPANVNAASYEIELLRGCELGYNVRSSIPNILEES